MAECKLLVGLGNPGSEYETTRHNLGFRVVEKVAQLLQCAFNYEKVGWYCIAKARVNKTNVLLAKPLTYMNRSGAAVREVLEIFQISLNDTMVIVDDFNLPFGKIRVRRKGSDGGHNGLASIIQDSGRQDFPRLRIGIGQESISDPVSFVLTAFDAEEQARLPELVNLAAEACLSFVEHGVTKTMSKYN
jgi:PTH1 family peptidyl-tRNA hydrolase